MQAALVTVPGAPTAAVTLSTVAFPVFFQRSVERGWRQVGPRWRQKLNVTWRCWQYWRQVGTLHAKLDAGGDIMTQVMRKVRPRWRFREVDLVGKWRYAGEFNGKVTMQKSLKNNCF